MADRLRIPDRLGPHMTHIRASNLGFDPPSNRLSPTPTPTAPPSNAAPMTSSLPWFRKGTRPGTIIAFEKPLSSQWKIIDKLNEYDDQATVEQNKAYGFRSFASAKFSCCDAKRRVTKAFMRVYIQVPHRTTEIDDANTRSQQAMSWTPQELASLLDLTEKGSNITPKLLAYKTSTQDRSGLVPGGFITWLVWEIVPGLRLGDGDGAGPFWGLEDHEREEVRRSFLNALVKLKEYGWYPSVDRARSLVWHQDTQTIYFIGRFSKTMEGEPRRLAEPAQRIATFELALPDVRVRWKDWDKDTSRWKW